MDLYPLPTKTTNQYAYVPFTTPNKQLPGIYARGPIPNGSVISLIAICKNSDIMYSSWVTLDPEKTFVRNNNVTESKWPLLTFTTTTFSIFKGTNPLEFGFRNVFDSKMYLDIEEILDKAILKITTKDKSPYPLLYLEPIGNSVPKDTLYLNVMYKIKKTNTSTFQNAIYGDKVSEKRSPFTIEGIYFIPSELPTPMYKYVGVTPKKLTGDLRDIWTGYTGITESKCSEWKSSEWSGCFFSDETQMSIGYAYNYCIEGQSCGDSCFGLCSENTCLPDFGITSKNPYTCTPKYTSPPTKMQLYWWILIISGILGIIVIIIGWKSNTIGLSIFLGVVLAASPLLYLYWEKIVS